FQPDAAHRQANVLLNLCEKAVSKEHVCRVLHFGKDDHINPAAGGFHHVNHVTIEKFCVNAVGPESANLAAKIKRGEGLNQRLPCSHFLRRGAAVLQVKDNLVGVSGGRLGHHLERMRRTGKLAAAHDDRRIMLWGWHQALLSSRLNSSGKLLSAERSDEFIVE